MNKKTKTLTIIPSMKVNTEYFKQKKNWDSMEPNNGKSIKPHERKTKPHKLLGLLHQFQFSSLNSAFVQMSLFQEVISRNYVDLRLSFFIIWCIRWEGLITFFCGTVKQFWFDFFFQNKGRKSICTLSKNVSSSLFGIEHDRSSASDCMRLCLSLCLVVLWSNNYR